MVDTEAVAQALFDLAKGAQTSALPFVSFSRRFQHWELTNENDWPCFYQFQEPARNVSGGARGLPVHRMKVLWIMYLRKSAGPDDPISPLLNQYYDALTNVLMPSFEGTKQTLGELVIDCFQDGDALTDEGLLDTPSLISIPITILIGI